MRKRDALKLHNRDEVEVRVNSATETEGGVEWIDGYVLGEPRQESGRVYVPVQTAQEGYLHSVDHADVR